MKQTITENGIIYELGENEIYYPQFELPQRTLQHRQIRNVTA